MLHYQYLEGIVFRLQLHIKQTDIKVVSINPVMKFLEISIILKVSNVSFKGIEAVYLQLFRE